MLGLQVFTRAPHGEATMSQDVFVFAACAVIQAPPPQRAADGHQGSGVTHQAVLLCVGRSNCPPTLCCWKCEGGLLHQSGGGAETAAVKKLQRCENAAATVSTSSHLQTGNHTEEGGGAPQPEPLSRGSSQAQMETGS